METRMVFPPPCPQNRLYRAYQESPTVFQSHNERRFDGMCEGDMCEGWGYTRWYDDYTGEPGGWTHDDEVCKYKILYWNPDTDVVFLKHDDTPYRGTLDLYATRHTHPT